MTSIQLIRGSFGDDHAVGERACVTTRRTDHGVVMYGPYEMRQPGGWRVTFSIGLADEAKPSDNPICAHVEVLTNEGRSLIAERRILFSELTHDLSSFELTFVLTEPRPLEYRIQTYGQVSITMAKDVEVRSLDQLPAPPAPRGSQTRAWEYEREFLDGYLRNVSGLIHVGANYGQERRYYWLLGLDVLWVEPIREVYEQLTDNIAKYPRQRALNALLSDEKGKEFEFRIANNGGASSSILPLEEHAELFPDVVYVENRKMTSTTLSDLVNEGQIDLSRYQALTIDTEGAELFVLNGARSILSHFEYVKCEAADFQSRSGNPTVDQLDEVMRSVGFEQIGRRDFGKGPNNVGTNWDITWKKVRPGEPLNEPGYSLPIVFDPLEVHGVEKEH
jgi:FkbM family methyltransferase